MILIAGVTMLFFGCEKDNSLGPDLSQGDEAEASLKAKKVPTHFAGISTPTTPPNPGDNAWYDAADDPRVTGIGVWITDGVEQINDITFELWGTAELTVDGGLGKWESTWHGTQTLTNTAGTTFRIVAHSVGAGTEGDVEGLTARWKYTMDFDGTPESFKYVIKGKITEVLP